VFARSRACKWTPPLTGPFWHERMISHAESVLSPLRLA
jgi:hypothetical protein